MKVEAFRCPRCSSRLAVNTLICCGCGRYVHWRSYVWECWLEFVIVAALIALMVITLITLVRELSEPRNPEPLLGLPQNRQARSLETDQP